MSVHASSEPDPISDGSNGKRDSASDGEEGQRSDWTGEALAQLASLGVGAHLRPQSTSAPSTSGETTRVSDWHTSSRSNPTEHSTSTDVAGASPVTTAAPQCAPSSPAADHTVAKEPYRTLVVGCLPHQVDTRQLNAHFEPFGRIVLAMVMLDVHTGRSRGFGFVWFEEPADAKRALEATNGTNFPLADAPAPTRPPKPLRVFPSDHAEGLKEAPAISVLNWPTTLHEVEARQVLSRCAEPLQLARVLEADRRVSSYTTLRASYATVLDARRTIMRLHGVTSVSINGCDVALQRPLVTKYDLNEEDTQTASVHAEQQQQSPQGSTGRGWMPVPDTTPTHPGPVGPRAGAESKPQGRDRAPGGHMAATTIPAHPATQPYAPQQTMPVGQPPLPVHLTQQHAGPYAHPHLHHHHHHHHHSSAYYAPSYPYDPSSAHWHHQHHAQSQHQHHPASAMHVLPPGMITTVHTTAPMAHAAAVPPMPYHHHGGVTPPGLPPALPGHPVTYSVGPPPTAYYHYAVHQ